MVKKKRLFRKQQRTTQNYLIGVVQGLRIDVQNMAHYYAESNNYTSRTDGAWAVNGVDRDRADELKSIGKRLDRLENRLRDTEVIPNPAPQHPIDTPKPKKSRRGQITKGVLASELYEKNNVLL